MTTPKKTTAPKVSDEPKEMATPVPPAPEPTPTPPTPPTPLPRPEEAPVAPVDVANTLDAPPAYTPVVSVAGSHGPRSQLELDQS